MKVVGSMLAVIPVAAVGIPQSALTEGTCGAQWHLDGFDIEKGRG